MLADVSETKMANSLSVWSTSINSAVECYLHTVEVVGSNPTSRTIFFNFLIFSNTAFSWPHPIGTNWKKLVSEWLADAVKKSSQPRQCQVACLILFGRQKITAFLSIKTARFGVDETSQGWWYQHQLLVRNLCRGAKRHYFCLQTCFIERAISLSLPSSITFKIWI